MQGISVWGNSNAELYGFFHKLDVKRKTCTFVVTFGLLVSKLACPD